MRSTNRLATEAARSRVLAQVSGEEAVLRSCTCLRCGNFWWPRGLNKPQRCAKCKSPYWSCPRTEKKRTGIRPDFLERPNKEQLDAIRDQLEASLRVERRTTEQEPDRTLGRALRILKEMKNAGRTWAEMADRIQGEFGAQLDKDQLKALVR